ncbi:LytR C-terminal domain-containing protein [Yinghuangia sp. YIM S09857]|uniref:LCP family protein n=1 Tax=Yinghuangia sp. YIM S09857 TaxID=3436929 RepID=UPI003F52A8C0
MTGSGERRDGRPYEGHRDGDPGYDPEVYPAGPYGAYGPGQDPGQGQGYAPDPAYGQDARRGEQYGSQYGGQYGDGQYGGEQYGGEQYGAGQGGQYGGQFDPGQSAPGQPGGYGSSAYETPAYDQQAYGTPQYGSPDQEAGGYGSGGYEAVGYEQSAYGYDPGGQPGGGYGGSGSYGTVPPPAPGPAVEYDSGAYAAYDGQAYPQSAPERSSGTGAAGAAGGTAAEPRVRRTGSTNPTEPAGTTGSFRVQVPAPAAPGEMPARPSRPAGRPAPQAPDGPQAPGRPGGDGPERPGAPRVGAQRSGTSQPGGRPGPQRPGTRGPAGGRPGPNRERVGYAADEFDFVDDDAEESEDVIDWLKFAETRSERRDERRRQLRNRAIGLVAVLVVAAVAVGGYFAYDKWWGGDSKQAAQATGGAVLIQLRGADGTTTASAVLADDPVRGSASMMTVASATIVNTAGGGPMPIADVMVNDGTGASRDALAQLMGVQLNGSWVVSEPVLQGLVDMVGGIELNADAEVKAPDGAVLLPAGPSANVRGNAARAYAALRINGEPPARGAERFGRVLQGVLKVLPNDPAYVADVLRNLANIADPSLPDDRLARVLTSMAKAVQTQKFKSADLPVRPDGILDVAAAGPIVKDLLGGSVTVAKADGPARVMITDASGKGGAQEAARVKVVNAGYSYVPGGAVEPKARPTSAVQYSDDARREAAVQTALTLGLPEAVVQKIEGEMLADVVVTLGQDYKP